MFLLELPSSPVIIILCTNLLFSSHSKRSFTRRTSGQSLGTFKQSSVLSDVGERRAVNNFHIVFKSSNG